MAVPDRPAAQAVRAAPRVPAIGLVLGAILSIQFGAALARTIFHQAGPAGACALRLVFAAVILLAVYRPRLRGRSREDLALVALFGLTLGAMNLLFYEAIGRIPLGVAVTFEFVGPLAVAAFGSRRRLDLVWAALAAAAVLLLADPGGVREVDALGAGLALAAGVCWGGYILVNARVGRRFARAEGLSLAIVLAAVPPVIAAAINPGPAILSGHALGIGAAVALLSSAIPYSLEMEALRRIPENVFGVLMSIEPAVAALAGFLVLGQSLGARQLVAIMLVVIASVGASRNVPPLVEA